MPRVLAPVSLAALACLLSPLSAGATPQDEFRSACLKAGATDEVCTCKAGAAVKLLDKRMLDMVVLSMDDPAAFTAMSQKGGLTHADNAAWTAYIRESNKACNLSY